MKMLENNGFSTIRVLIAKVGLDGHDRGALIVARALREARMDVTYSGIRKSPAWVADKAREIKPHCVGLSSLAGSHLTHFPEVSEELRKRGLHDVLLIGGGIIPDEDIPALRMAGFAAIFTPGSRTDAIVRFIRSELHGRAGRSQASLP